MLTVIDKLDYKRKNDITFTKNEEYFFRGKDFRNIINLLKEKRIPPIYIDTESRTEYLDALSLADKTGDCTSLVILIEKRVISTLTEIHCYPYFK